MKKIFNLAIFFFILAFTLVLSLLSEPSMAHAQQPIKSTDSVQNIQRETVVLISNNILNGGISSRQRDNNNGFTGACPIVIAYTPVIDSSYKTTLQFNGEYIANLSNNNQKALHIRAP